MKTLIAAAALAALGTAAAADPIEGIWQTIPDDNGNFGFVQIAPCGANFCGNLIRAFDGAGNQISSPNVGRQIIIDTSADGGGAYSGQIYSPDRDRTYSSRLSLAGDRLSVSGCVLGICRDGGTWRRVQ